MFNQPQNSAFHVEEAANLIRTNRTTDLINAVNRMPQAERYPFLTNTNANGANLLHIAAEAGNMAAVQYLLGMNVPMDSKNQANQTALDIAHAANHPLIVTLLTTRMEWKERLGNLQMPLNRALNLIQGSYEAIEPGRGKELVLVLGETGVGKSTLLNYLNGAQYRLEGLAGFNQQGVLENGEEIAAVGHNPMLSETLYPQVLRVGNMDMADLAGMNGVREPVVELAGTLSTHLLAQLSCGTKGIVFVVDAANLSAVKGTVFRQTIRTLNHILQNNFNDARQSVFFAITKLLKGVTAEDVIDQKIRPLVTNLEQQNLHGGLDNEDVELLRTLHLMIANPQNLFVPDVTDTGQSRQQLLQAVANSVPLPQGHLNLLRVDRHQENFATLLTFLSEEYNRRAVAIREQLPLALQQKHQQIADENAAISGWENDIAANRQAQEEGMTPARTQAMVAEKQRQGNEVMQQLQERLTEQAGLRVRVQHRQETKQALDTDEPVNYGNPYRFQHIQQWDNIPGRDANFLNKASLGLFGKGAKAPEIKPKSGNGTHIFENKNAPAPGNIVNLERANQGGHFGHHTLQRAIFNLPYSYPLGQSVSAEVIVQLAKRDIPENRIRIERCAQEITENESRLTDLETEIARYRDKYQQLQQEIQQLQLEGIDAATQIANLGNAIQQREEWMVTARDNIAKLETDVQQLSGSRGQLKQELTVNQDVFRTMKQIIGELGLATVENLLFQEFVDNYQRLNPAPGVNPGTGSGLFAEHHPNPAQAPGSQPPQPNRAPEYRR